MSNDFLSDLEVIRERARRQMEEGAVTPAYQADRTTVLRLLNEALATELVCVLRYKRHYHMASGLCSGSVQAEFLEHATDEQGHADRLAARIVQLGGAPDFSPKGLVDRSHSEYAEGLTLVEMIRQDLIAERIAIESYSQMIRYIGMKDPTTRVLLEEILAVEEEHAQDMAGLLENLGPAQAGGEPMSSRRQR
jgi:bacterioferritin